MPPSAGNDIHSSTALHNLELRVWQCLLYPLKQLAMPVGKPRQSRRRRSAQAIGWFHNICESMRKGLTMSVIIL